MDKLEKLENLYQEFWEDEFKKKGMHNPAKFIDTQPFMYRSKEFGFIKWLVDNDKIEQNKIKKLYYLQNEHNTETYPVMSEFNVYERVLMLISIQGSPIGFLISILK